MHKKSNKSMTQYANEYKHKAEQIQPAGIEPDDLLSIMMLAFLPLEYESFTVAIESRDELLSFEYLKTKLKEEEARQNDREAKSRQSDKTSEALFTKNNKRRYNQTRTYAKERNNTQNNQIYNRNCFKCGKPNHMSRNCRYKINYNNSRSALIAITCNTELAKLNNWYLDNGA